MEQHPDTRQRLIRAAGEIISRKGFRAATVREICARAGANVAAVKYYFGSKKRLYEELLRYALEEGLRQYPTNADLPPDPTPEQRLRAFIFSLLLRLHDEGRSSWFGKLMTREMFEPTEALEQILVRGITPLSNQLRDIVADMAGSRLDSRTIRLCAVSIAAQCQHFYRARSVISRVYPDLRFDRRGLNELTEHILRFSLAAIHAYAQP